MGVSSHVFNRENVEKNNSTNKGSTVFIKAIFLMVTMYFLSEFADSYAQKISRRLVNFSYIMFMSCLVLSCIVFFTCDALCYALLSQIIIFF